MSFTILKATAAAVALSVSANGLAMPQPQGSAFSVDAIAPSEPQLIDPAAELQRLQAKYPTSSEIVNIKRDGSGQKGPIPATPQKSGLAFYVPTVIGNQTFQMIFDTGSADLWVYSNESSPYQSLDHPVYIPTASAELLQNYTWAIKYAGGEEVSGVVFTDNVQAGPVVAHKQAVQAATKIPFEFGSDGILGLAFSKINTVKPTKQKTFFENLLPTLERKLFAANLRGDGKPSTWDFGYIDESKFSGDILYTPVVSEKYWSVNVGSYAVGEGSFTGSDKQVGEVIVDSGTSLVFLPESIVKEYYSQVEGYELQWGTHTFWCNGTIPDLNFKIEDRTLSIPGSQVNYTVYDPAKGTCVGGITSQLNMKYSVLGNLFMKNYYVVHSLEEERPRVGFASH